MKWAWEEMKWRGRKEIEMKRAWEEMKWAWAERNRNEMGLGRNETGLVGLK
jgi:hypothetical protein